MKHFFTSLTIFLSFAASGFAQVNGTGYYRVVSQGLTSQGAYYCSVAHREVYMAKNNLMNQTVQAIHLVQGEYAANSDPSTILYITDPNDASKFNIYAQGINLRSTIDPQAMELHAESNGTYRITAKKYDTTADLKNGTTLINNHHYECLTYGSGSSYWKIYPYKSDSEKHWFGIQPTLEAEGKYYASFYAAFPFKCKSSGMKVYYVSAADDEHFELTEITDDVPPATPVLIECSSSNPKENLIDILEPNNKSISGNKLTGVYFCNQYLYDGKSSNFHGFKVDFDPATMRVWNVKDGKLVLSTDEAGLFKGNYKGGSYDYRGRLFIKANSGYLPVAKSANETLTLGTTALNKVDTAEPKIVTITNVAGQKVNQLVPGVNIIKYSDGSVKKVIK